MKLNTNRLWITVNDPMKKKKDVLKEDLLTFAEMNLVEENVNLLVKDLGFQVSWRLTYVLEYIGPLVIFPAHMWLAKTPMTKFNK